MRHNNIRNYEANLLREICKDVKIEPDLLPIEVGNGSSTNTDDRSRLDVSAVGLWAPMQRTFLDVRVFHPNSASYLDKTAEQLYIKNDIKNAPPPLFSQQLVEWDRNLLDITNALQN